jgi:hypothetical protein
MPTVDEIANAMYEMVKSAQGQKKLKPTDLTKAMIGQLGASKADCKLAIRQLVESERCVYTYFGGSYIELPHAEGAAGGQ